MNSTFGNDRKLRHRIGAGDASRCTRARRPGAACARAIA